jgi:hypothetical protein
MEPRPLRRNEIVRGKTYLTLEVWRDGSMHLTRWKALSKLTHRKDGWWVRHEPRQRRESKADDFLFHFLNLEDMGVGLRPRKDTYHRTFADTPGNEFLLRKMMRGRGALKRWIALLGFANPDLHVKELATLCKNARRDEEFRMLAAHLDEMGREYMRFH